MRPWADVSIGIFGVRKVVVFSFDGKEIYFQSSYPMSPETIKQILEIILKLKDYFETVENVDPLDLFKKVFGLLRINFSLDHRFIFVQDDAWIAASYKFVSLKFENPIKGDYGSK